jgi:hypothetical protein
VSVCALLLCCCCTPSPSQTHTLGGIYTPPAAAVAGRWAPSSHTTTIPDPLNGEPFVQLPDTQEAELDHFVASLLACPKSGLHNPFKNPERCGRMQNAVGRMQSRQQCTLHVLMVRG